MIREIEMGMEGMTLVFLKRKVVLVLPLPLPHLTLTKC